uniref:Uncharacterized protein n=1 Tax=Manihot esculenta TaxID=3983 RepID=A0A199UAR4_MANES
MGLIFGPLKLLHHQIRPLGKCISPNNFESSNPKPPDLSPLRNIEIQPLSSPTMHTFFSHPDFSKPVHISNKIFPPNFNPMVLQLILDFEIFQSRKLQERGSITVNPFKVRPESEESCNSRSQNSVPHS